jgi:hypothetical protein
LTVAAALIDDLDESGGYDRLSTIQGTFIPRCYGCYICPVPGQNRNAWVLLLQYIPGRSLDKIDPSQLSPYQRWLIMDKMVDAASDVAYVGGVDNRDYALRNTILWLGTDSVPNQAIESDVTPAPMPSIDIPPSHGTIGDLSTASVVIIDFEHARFDDFSSERYQRLMKLLKLNKWTHDLTRFEEAGWVTLREYEETDGYYVAC